MKGKRFLATREDERLFSETMQRIADIFEPCIETYFEPFSFPKNVQTFADKVSYVAENYVQENDSFGEQDEVDKKVVDRFVWAGAVAIPTNYMVNHGLPLVYRPDEVANPKEPPNLNEFILHTDKIAELPETFLLVENDDRYEATYIQLTKSLKNGTMHLGGVQYICTGEVCEDCGHPMYAFVQLPETDFSDGDSIATVMDRVFCPEWYEHSTIECVILFNLLLALDYLTRKPFTLNKDMYLRVGRLDSEN